MTRGSLTAECAVGDLPEGGLRCSDELTIECGSADAQVIYITEDAADVCEGPLTVSDAGPYTVGTHAISVTDGTGAELCASELTVEDTVAPTIEEHTLFLWPPNHKLHDIRVSDCVTVRDDCDTALQGEFIWASADEPINDIGDGNHEPDIVFGDCETVAVRAERQGPRDGRVYRLGVRAVDGGGNSVEGSCTILVDHDQRGVVAADSGDAYRIELDGTDGAPSCDGVTELPPANLPPEGGDGDGSEPPTPPADEAPPSSGDGDMPGDDEPPADGPGDGDETPPVPLPGSDGPV